MECQLCEDNGNQENCFLWFCDCFCNTYDKFLFRVMGNMLRKVTFEGMVSVSGAQT